MPEQTRRSRDTLAGEGPLPTLFQSEARANIIEALVRNSSRELNVSEIARLSDTSRTTVYEHLDRLVELGIVAEIERGGTKRYTLDKDDKIADLLNKLQGATLRRQLEVDEGVEL